jgi:ATP-dependent helicase/nuclease subunit A
LNLNASVQASAGSGKTYLLINRLVRLLLLGADPASVLAITFTRKAAAEMQNRLLQKVYELSCAAAEELDLILTELGVNNITAAHRLQARNLYEQLLHATHPVKVTTFHAFCQDILRRFPLEADVPPGFELIEKTRTLQHQAIEALMVEAAQKHTSKINDALTWLIEQFGLHTTNLMLITFIEQRSEWWAFTQFSGDPVKYAKSKLEEQLNIPDYADPLDNLFSQNNFLTQLDVFSQLLLLHPTKTNSAHAGLLITALKHDQELSDRYRSIYSVFFKTNNEPRSRKSTAVQQKKMGEEKEDKFLSIHNTCCEVLNQVRTELNVLLTLKMNQAWYTAGSHALELYQRFKHEQRLLDFADLEWKTYKLLAHHDNAQWIQYKLDARIEHLLIDEFQDTNPTQWHLISPILKEIASQENNFRSVFLVGDAKQSIYRFRRAEPRLFDHAVAWMNSALKAETIPLNKSWRSAPAIINLINTIFGSGPLHQQLAHFIPHEVHYKKRWGKVTILPLINLADAPPDQSPWRNSLKQPRAEKIPLRYKQEAEQITQVIKQLITSNTLVGDADNARLIRYSDIIILMRNRTHIIEYEQALRYADIPFISNARGTLLKSLEIADMVNLLQWLNMPHDNLALAGILRSPLFSISDNDLIVLASTAGRFWYDRLSSLNQTLADDHPLCLAAQLLEQWRSLAGHIPVHDLLDHIYSSGNVLARFAASYPEYQRDRVTANLNGFIGLALDMDSGRYPSLMRFIQWLNELYKLDSDAPDEPVSNQSSNRVRLLTIHAAKGLEAPVVFLVDSTHKPKSGNTYTVLLNWPIDSNQPDALLLTPTAENQEPFTLSLVEQKMKDDTREEANLLYASEYYRTSSPRRIIFHAPNTYKNHSRRIRFDLT